jgi:nitrite reductase (NO-forming)
VLAIRLGVGLPGRGWQPLAGVPHDRLVAIHLTLGLLGWLTLLIVAVGRTLASMLALAPSEPRRSAPVAESVFAAGLTVAIGGLAAGSTWLTAAGAAVLAAVLARFGVLLARVARENRLERPEGPLVHFLIGILCLAEAAVAIGVLLAGDGSPRLQQLAVVLVLGWATGVTLGHVGKLLAVSAWTWWPPGPRPKQAAFYPRRVWLAEAAAFGVGIQLVAAGILGDWQAPLTAGAAILVAGAVLAVAGCLRTVTVSVPSLRLGGHA